MSFFTDAIVNFFNFQQPKQECNSYDSLDRRMQRRLTIYNDNSAHCYKPYIISLKSKELLSYINLVTDIKDKLDLFSKLQKMHHNISKQLYRRFEPHMIYTFNDEIHLVFYHNKHGDYIYNGNINRMITAVTSYASILTSREFEQNGWKNDYIYTCKFIEFSEEYETLNYLVWRQLNCRRNNITLLWKCLNMEDYLNCKVKYESLKVDVMKADLDTCLDSIEVEEVRNVLTGNIFKKIIIYKEQTNKDDTSKNISKRKEILKEHFFFNENFKEFFYKYIKNKVL